MSNDGRKSSCKILILITYKDSFKPFLYQAKLSPTYAFLNDDFDKVGKADLLVLSNFFETKTELMQA